MFHHRCSTPVESSNEVTPMEPTTNYRSYSNNEGACRRPYNGFSTSISALFSDPLSRRVDCCSVACCGMLQSDHTRFLLTGTLPPPVLKRVLLHILIPLGLFLMAGYCAITIPDAATNQAACVTLLLCLLIWIVTSCRRATLKRAQVRKELLWRLRQLDDTPAEQHQTDRQMTCAHCRVGCYSDDTSASSPPIERDLCSFMFQAFTRACCYQLCGCHLQLCGMCALAQEAREMKLLIPATRLDYVTFEPYVNYMNRLRHLRATGNTSLVEHWKNLSILSQRLVRTLIGIILLLTVLSLFNQNHDKRFHFANMLVLLATFCQAFFILHIVHWKWNPFDISLDAVIKFFATGFLLTTGLAVAFEILVTLLLKLLMIIVMGLADVDTATSIGYGFGTTFGRDYNIMTSTVASMSEDSKKEFRREYPGVIVFYLFLNAFATAALIEELCKYFGYKMTEHPDFLSEDELAEVAAAPRIEEEEVSFDVDSVESSREGPILTNVPSAEEEIADRVVDDNNNDDYIQEPYQYFPPRTLNSLASGITVAMVSVALGFACCENLIYIFVYNGSSIGMEVSVLIARSLFPVHPICAAIQSIGVCKSELEMDSTVKLGGIVFPAIVVHGTFDFSIMVLSFLSTLASDDESDATSEKIAIQLGLYSLSISIGIVATGLIYFVIMSKAQRHRLERLEMARTTTLHNDLTSNPI